MGARAPGRYAGSREIMGCVRTKLAVVAEDERDGGRRQVLNLGHTVAHAIEAASGYGAIATARRSASACSPPCACRAARP